MSLAKKITRAREKAGLSQAELAKKLGLEYFGVGDHSILVSTGSIVYDIRPVGP